MPLTPVERAISLPGDTCANLTPSITCWNDSGLLYASSKASSNFVFIAPPALAIISPGFLPAINPFAISTFSTPK